MQAYRLRHSITFQQPVETRDPLTGGLLVDWQDAEVGGKKMVGYPAEVLTGEGRELLAADTIKAQIAARINVPWFSVGEQELATWRILWDGRIYNIESISTDKSARREWRFKCSGGVNNG